MCTITSSNIPSASTYFCCNNFYRARLPPPIYYRSFFNDIPNLIPIAKTITYVNPNTYLYHFNYSFFAISLISSITSLIFQQVKLNVFSFGFGLTLFNFFNLQGNQTYLQTYYPLPPIIINGSIDDIILLPLPVLPRSGHTFHHFGHHHIFMILLTPRLFYP